MLGKLHHTRATPKAVERAFKIVSDASSQVIRQRIRSKKPMPKVDTKRDL